MTAADIWSPAAILADLDGTLVDSVASSERAWGALARRRGLDEDETHRFAMGRPTRETIALLVPEDERVAEHLADDEISIGNYVLSGGELAAAVVIDTVARLLPGVLGNETSAAFDSFQESGHGEGVLDCPHWTRPADFRGWKPLSDLQPDRISRLFPARVHGANQRKRGLRPQQVSVV